VRLNQIKLAGFKSFVDPTSFQVPGQRVGVVGPNGCGKSNIIDAVRWVLGETRASELRGESMQDVIFNGSGQRKPAGRASVELVFDNSSGRAAGQWSQYAEIAVKRVLTRDGTSTYYINNQVVRRRDIQDIFLGTGLGPRAYAIIGQGMISRIIEARPEELRIFLEEAAGVSKYKERRRETENRLADTRENLTRVEDILRELGGNLEKLEAQAEVAQRYRQLQADQDATQAQIWVLRRDEARAEQARHLADTEAARNQLEARMADLRRVEADLEGLRTHHFAASDTVHAAQGRLYEVNAAISSLEAEIRYVLESRNRLKSQIAALDAQREHWSSRRREQEAELAEVEGRLEQAERTVEENAARLAEHDARLPDLEIAAVTAQQRTGEARGRVQKIGQDLQLEAAHQRNADRNAQNLQIRRERLVQEQSGLERPDNARLDELRAACDEDTYRLVGLGEELAVAEAQQPVLEERRQLAQEALVRESTALTQLSARLAAVRQMQQRVQLQGKLEPWLSRHELASLPRLWQRLHIEAGWETALEAVLRERMAAMELRQLDWVRAFFADAPPAKLTFFSSSSSSGVASVPAAVSGGLIPLVDLLRCDDADLRRLLSGWLDLVFVAENPEEALARRTELPDGGSFVVRAGHCIGRDSVRFYAPDSEQDGMLARQQEIENLDKQLRGHQLLSDEAKSRAVQAEAAFGQGVAEMGRLRSLVATLTQTAHARQLEFQRLAQQSQQVESRSGQISEELADVAAQIEHETALRVEAEGRFEELDARLVDAESALGSEEERSEAARQALSAAREMHRQLDRAHQEAGFALRNLNNKIIELNNNIQVSSEQSERARETLGGVQIELEGLADETAQAGLQEALDRRIAAEEGLTAARRELDDLAGQLRTADEQRLSIERQLEPLRERINGLQLKEQAARLAHEQFAGQLAESGADVAAICAYLESEDGRRLRPNTLQAELNRVHEAISGLGAVNLAALDELATASERKGFLDAQLSDLTEAMETLEDAIRKIDRETRTLLQSTFDAVNIQFGELFPLLFGGGEARLVMTGAEILDAGVQVMAQPPGKKNSTIHLLSGGEKALTATALVFALFQLNPAPFCLLDEVDAPLDDANTDRFCNLVKRMSESTQFLFISHNKIAMEMAEQLIGVTMQEQGVSRIVAVDMEEAVRFAAKQEERVTA